MSTTLSRLVTDTAGVVETLRDAVATRTPMRIVGAGTWPGAGHPVRADRVLPLAALSGVVEYVPGDLTLTARAGTPLAEIAGVTSAHGQWLPLDPPGSVRGTIGATVATGSAGPLAHGFGPPRDLVLGIECVTGRGDVVRGGGRVTKNVAGFDLARLFTGSWGTLGVLTEVTVRLRARPLVDTTVAIRMPTDDQHLPERLRAIRAAPIEPLALELVSGGLAGALGLGSDAVLLVRLGGNADAVRGQRMVLDALGDAMEVAPTVWDALRGIEPSQSWTWRLSDLPSRVAETWSRAEMMLGTGPAPWIHASVGRGIVRCIDTPERPSAGMPYMSPEAIKYRRFEGTMIVERLPHGAAFPRESDQVRDRIARRLREAFDPHALLNPGILGEDEA